MVKNLTTECVKITAPFAQSGVAEYFDEKINEHVRLGYRPAEIIFQCYVFGRYKNFFKRLFLPRPVEKEQWVFHDIKLGVLLYKKGYALPDGIGLSRPRFCICVSSTEIGGFMRRKPIEAADRRPIAIWWNSTLNTSSVLLSPEQIISISLIKKV